MKPVQCHQAARAGTESIAGLRCPQCRRQVGALFQPGRPFRAAAPAAWICQGCVQHLRRHLWAKIVSPSAPPSSGRGVRRGISG